ncbi:MAG: rod shape-determining protein MreC [Actinomycetota bacterium]
MHDNRWNRMLLTVLLTAAVGLITIDYRDSSATPMHDLRQIGAAAFSTTETVSAAVTGPLTGLLRTGAGGQPSQVAALQAQLTRLRAELSRTQISRQQSRQLTRLLRLAGHGGYHVVAASVVAVSQGYQDSVTLDAGRAEGVSPEQTALNGAGLVGTVTAVTAHSCTVLLATDTASVVGIRLAGSGQAGWVTGTGKSHGGSGLLSLQVLGSRVTLRPGQQLVTAASVHDRPYVPGVPVGVVSQVQGRAGGLTARALVRPYADLSALGVVGVVVTPPRRDPGYTVLPPSSSPRTSAASAGPSMPASSTPVPSTPAPSTPVPSTPAPSTPVPSTPAPVPSAQLTPRPTPTSSAPAPVAGD